MTRKASATAPTPPNLASKIVLWLREEIISGRCQPGEALAEPVLAAHFSVSRAPVREALIELEREGLVQFESTGRTRVRTLTQKDFNEIVEARMALESMAAKKAAARWTPEDSAVLEENIAAQSHAVTLSELSRLDVELHEYIMQRCGNDCLLALWQGIRWQFEMCLASTHRLQQKLAFKPRRITVNSHRRVLTALASGKPEVAARTMSSHIEDSLEWSMAEVTELPKPKRRKSTLAADAAKVAVLMLAAFWSIDLTAASTDPQGEVFFESKVRPLLIEHCYDCHSGVKTKGGLSLETRTGWATGGEAGPAIVPGKPDESLLIQAVRQTHAKFAMPPKSKGGKLSDDKITVLEEWVRMGAPDPREAVSKIGGMSADEAKTWWAFQPLRAFPEGPCTSAQIDAFIDSRLTAAGLPASPLADKHTLIRRATFDLTGLPPTVEEVEAFMADAAQDAFAKVIDRLLAAPQYGEKWGRHWLDIARYADSLDERSYDKDGDILDAWKYRDWVVNAFNKDLPYDQFITQQVAGDILAAKQWDPQKVIATGLYAIGNWGNGDADKEKVHTDIVDDQIDVTGRAFLGLTLACVRCHDHKFDPLTSKDYYGMAGMFFSSRILVKFAAKGEGERLMRIPLLSPDQAAHREQLQKRVAEIDAELSAALEPFTVVKRDVAGKAGLVSWSGIAADNPSLFMNLAEEPVAFYTIKQPARSVALHPGPKVGVSAVWRSPVSGTVKVAAQLRDIDPTGGDGVAWFVRKGGETIKAGEMNNGGSADVKDLAVTVQAGDLVQLVIRPRGDYFCDATQINVTVQDEKGAAWDLRETLVGGAEQGRDNIWWVCSGEGTALGANPHKAALEAERKQLEKDLALTEFAQGLQEGGITLTKYEGYHDAQIHRRGSYDQLGETVPRSLPALLTKRQPVLQEGSGRMELAQWMTDKENPLTARVMVNRLWQHHFGEGIVRTPNNFGKLGTPPSHPELLDWLASEFIRSGWSVKHLHRLIMGTAAYQRSAIPTEQARQVDADNKLLSHQRRRRLTAEELRDAMLSVSGRLDVTMGGKAVRDLMANRRTLYLTTIRSDRSSYQALFDGADSTAIVDQRTEATIAPQSLFLLNHPFTLAQAEALAAESAKAAPDPAVRLRWLWQRLFQHEPGAEEVAFAAQALGTGADPARWTLFCQMLLCSNEFAYVD